MPDCPCFLSEQIAAISCLLARVDPKAEFTSSGDFPQQMWTLPSATNETYCNDMQLIKLRMYAIPMGEVAHHY